MKYENLKRRITKDISLLACQNDFIRRGRYFRRYYPDSISVMKSFFSKTDSSAGDESGVRLFLFMGVCYPFIPGVGSIKSDGGILLPEDADCIIRLFLHKTIDQTPQRWQSDCWDLSSEAEWNESLPRFTQLFKERALPWFERYSNLQNSLHDLLNLKEDMRATHGMGLIGSIRRLRHAVFIALKIDELSIARQCVDELCSLSYAPTFASENPIFLELKEKLG